MTEHEAVKQELEDLQDEMEALRCRTVFEDRLKRGDVTVWELMLMYDELYRGQRDERVPRQVAGNPHERNAPTD